MRVGQCMMKQIAANKTPVRNATGTRKVSLAGSLPHSFPHSISIGPGCRPTINALVVRRRWISDSDITPRVCGQRVAGLVPAACRSLRWMP